MGFDGAYGCWTLDELEDLLSHVMGPESDGRLECILGEIGRSSDIVFEERAVGLRVRR